MIATIINCIAVAAGAESDYELLLTKSVLDGFVAVIFAAALGIGVAFSSLSILVYQGSLTMLAKVLQPLATELVLGELTGLGGVSGRHDRHQPARSGQAEDRQLPAGARGRPGSPGPGVARAHGAVLSRLAREDAVADFPRHHLAICGPHISLQRISVYANALPRNPRARILTPAPLRFRCKTSTLLSMLCDEDRGPAASHLRTLIGGNRPLFAFALYGAC